VRNVIPAQATTMNAGPGTPLLAAGPPPKS
jgi:hypothetical protein